MSQTFFSISTQILHKKYLRYITRNVVCDGYCDGTRIRNLKLQQQCFLGWKNVEPVSIVVWLDSPSLVSVDLISIVDVQPVSPTKRYVDLESAKNSQNE